MEFNFKPASNKCLDCGCAVELSDRQEIAWDLNGECRRRCGPCIIKFDMMLTAYRSQTLKVVEVRCAKVG